MNGNWDGYVYEHIQVYFEFHGIIPKEDDIIHHLDGNKMNNRHENLILLSKGDHSKLHAWLDSNRTINEEVECCKICGRTLQDKQRGFCSIECYSIDSRKNIPSKEHLEELIKTNCREAIGRMFGVSGNAVKKWMIGYEII